MFVDARAGRRQSGMKQAALVHFVERVGADEADALRRARPNSKAGHADEA